MQNVSVKEAYRGHAEDIPQHNRTVEVVRLFGSSLSHCAIVLSIKFVRRAKKEKAKSKASALPSVTRNTHTYEHGRQASAVVVTSGVPSSCPCGFLAAAPDGV